MLDDRKAAILRVVVEEYVRTGQPVGSAYVGRAGVGVSSATIRNEMALLEREGYLAQPHTSAGRIPTDKGYRYFVDHTQTAWGPGELSPSQRTQVREFFQRTHRELEDLLVSTSSLLSRLTDHTAMVVAPVHDVVTVRSVAVLQMGGTTGMVIAVLSDGAIHRSEFEVPTGDDEVPVGDEVVGRAGARLTRALYGCTLAELGSLENEPSGEPELDAVMEAASAALAQPREGDIDHVFVGGASKTADAFDAIGTVRQVLNVLEQQYVVVTLLNDVMERGLSVAIGSEEHGMVSLSDCALVVAPYEADGERLGSIGLLGPTRMNYPQALAAVAVVSERLGHHLEERG